jgi:hypothetical protein
MVHPMSTSSVPLSSGGCRTFSVAAWNIHCGQNAGLASAATGLAQMGVAVAVLTGDEVGGLASDGHGIMIPITVPLLRRSDAGKLDA